MPNAFSKAKNLALSAGFVHPADEPARLRFGEPTVKDSRRRRSRILNDDCGDHRCGSAVEQVPTPIIDSFSPEKYLHGSHNKIWELATSGKGAKAFSTTLSYVLTTIH